MGRIKKERSRLFMKILIIYYSQSGNTRKIAKAIVRGARSAGAVVDVVKLKDASYQMMDDYDMIGIGSPVWKADTPNMHGFIDKMPDQKGKHCFAFNTHGALPYLYFPIVLPNLKNHGLLPIGYRDWYGNVTMPGMPKPYYTYGHPDAQDVMEAEAFGREMAENSPKIAAGDTSLIYPDPEMDDKVFQQAMICSNMLLCPTNPQGTFIRDASKCLYPKCTKCMDNCTMGYIDLTKTPQKFGNRGDRCDDCHECSFCLMLCPAGAIDTDPPILEHAKGCIGKRHLTFEKMLDDAEKASKFRRLIPVEEVGFNTPYVIAHPRHPYFVIPKETDEE